MFGETYARARIILLETGGCGFFREGELEWGQWSTADRVEVRFRGSNGDQLGKGAILTRPRKGPPRPVDAGRGVVDIMSELLS